MPGPLLLRTDPIENEGLMSLVTRAATRNVLPSWHPILEQVGATHPQNPTAAINPNLDTDLLARILRLPSKEITRRQHPATADSGYVDFFGAAVRADELIFRRRRFAPAAVRKSAHIRALWSLKTIPCCTETWQYLTDICHACGTLQGWRHAWHFDRCDRCGIRLDRAEADVVAPPLRDGLGFLIGLLDPDPEHRQRARAELPDTLAEWDGGMVFELALALMRVTSVPYRPNRGDVISAEDRVDYATALAQTAPLVRAWPATLVPALERAVILQSYSGQSVYTGLAHHVPALGSKILPVTVRAAIMKTLDPLRFSHGATPVDQIDMVKATALLGHSQSILAVARREGRLRTRVCLRDSRLLPTLDRAEANYIRDFIDNRISAEATSRYLNLPAYAIPLIADARRISTENHPFLAPRYTDSQLHRAEFDRFKIALRAAAIPQNSDAKQVSDVADPVWLHRAARAIGGGLKPWGWIIDQLLSGAIPFRMSEERASRIQIAALEAHKLQSLDLTLTKSSMLPPTCSQRDALEILNLPGKHSHLLKQLAGADDEWEMDWDAVLNIARTRITLTELHARSGIYSVTLERLLDEEGCPRIDQFGWQREQALTALPHIIAAQAARRSVLRRPVRRPLTSHPDCAPA